MRSPRRYKTAIYEQLARVGKALGSAPRLELVDLLRQGPRTVEVLATHAGQSIANTSHHLQVLRRARLVETEKQGVHVSYRLANADVCALFRSLRGLAESRLAEVEQITRAFLEERDAMEPVDLEALVNRVRNGEVTVVDVRPIEEYRAGHIPGALSVPLADLERSLADLPPDRDVVAYCRGPYCVMALVAVDKLREHGFDAVRLDEGVPEWRERGLDIEVGEQP